MSLKNVVEDIREEARKQADEILEQAERDANSIIESAQQEAEQIIDERERAVEREIAQEREQRLSSAKLEVKQDRLETKRDILTEVEEAVETRLGELSGERRESLTRVLLEDALDEFEGHSSIHVRGREGDVDLLEELIAEGEWEVAVAGGHDCLGGVIVTSEESKIRVDNTFDAVLEDVWEENLKDVSETLFEEE